MKDGLGANIEEWDEEGRPSGAPSTSSTPCVLGESRAALDTLFHTTPPWYIFASQVPNKLEGRSVKGEVKSMVLAEIGKRCISMFEVGMAPREFCERYSEGLEGGVISGGDEMLVRWFVRLGWCWD